MWDNDKERYECRVADNGEICPEVQCETECPCNCDIDPSLCRHCDFCIDGICTDQCVDGERCCFIEEADKYECVVGNCCTDADCDIENGYFCVNHNCQSIQTDPAICDTVTRYELDGFIDHCREYGCERNLHYAFNIFDFRDYTRDELYFHLDTYQGNIYNTNIYCKEDTEEPCCDVESCGNSLGYSWVEFEVCTMNQCSSLRIGVPWLHSWACSYYRNWNLHALNWYENVVTCGDMRAGRNTLWTNCGSTCNRDKGSDRDTEMPCVMQLIDYNSTSSSCPVNCRSIKAKKTRLK